MGGAVDRTRVKRVLREAFWEEAARLPAGSDYVVVARPERCALPSARATPGIRTALAELVDELGGAAHEDGRVIALIRAYQRVHLAAAPAPLQVPPDVLGLRGAGDRVLRHTARLRARGLAAAALQSLQPRRLRPGVGADPVPGLTLTTLVIANIFQPLIDFFEQILLWFHDVSG